MQTYKFVFFSIYYLLFHIRFTLAVKNEVERALRKHLLGDNLNVVYNRDLYPTMPVDVSLKIKLFGIDGVDDKSSTFKAIFMLHQEWNDMRLAWKPCDWEGIRLMKIKPDTIWLPDIGLVNHVGDYKINDARFVVVHYDGKIEYKPTKRSETYCSLSAKGFPLDKHTCNITIAPVVFDHKMVRLNIDEYPVNRIDQSLYSDSHMWELLSIKTSEIELYGDQSCPHSTPLSSLSYILRIRRKAMWSSIYFFIPMILISIVATFTFYLPANSCEKTTLAITVLVVLTFFLSAIPAYLPKTSCEIPLISRFLVFAFTIVGLEQGVSVIIINFNYRDPYIYIMNNTVRRVFLEILPEYLWMRLPKTRADQQNYNLNLTDFMTMTVENSDNMANKIRSSISKSFHGKKGDALRKTLQKSGGGANSLTQNILNEIIMNNLNEEERSELASHPNSFLNLEELGDGKGSTYNLHEHTAYNKESALTKTDLPWTDIAKTHQKALSFGLSTRNKNRPTLKSRVDNRNNSTTSDTLMSQNLKVDNRDPNRYQIRKALKHKCKKISMQKQVLSFLSDNDRCKSHYHINTYTDNIQRQSEVRTEVDDWIYLGMVIDRLLMYIFVIVNVIGGLIMFYDYVEVDWFR